MLPHELPPLLTKKFTEAVIQKLDEDLEAGGAVAFVNDIIARFEKEGLDPFQALEKAHEIICKPQTRGNQP
jgi:hypothetical protein